MKNDSSSLQRDDCCIKTGISSPARAKNNSDFNEDTVFPYWQLGSGGNLDVFEPPLSFWGMAQPESGTLWNWLTSATYAKGNVRGITVAVTPADSANRPIVQASLLEQRAKNIFF